jgi:hypothetical protein
MRRRKIDVCIAMVIALARVTAVPESGRRNRGSRSSTGEACLA